MKIGVSIASNIASADLAVEAERLGFDSFWGTDSQLLWSDVYSYLALAAERTERIQLGPAVAVAPTRLAPVTAQSIATINRLAPGRVRLGLGTAHTAMRTMGMKPMPAAEFADYVRVVAELLRTGETEYELDGVRRPIRFLQPQFDGLRLEPRIPLFVSATGPRGQRLAGRFGDGVMANNLGTTMPAVRENVARGMAGRGAAPESFEYLFLSAVAVAHPGESLTCDAMVDAMGPQVLSMYHMAWDAWVLDPDGYVPPDALAPRWEEYLDRMGRRFAEHNIAPERQYQSIHDLHGTFVAEDERDFVTPDLLRAYGIVGEQDEVVHRLREVAATGVTELIVRIGYAGAAATMARLAPVLAELR